MTIYLKDSKIKKTVVKINYLFNDYSSYDSIDDESSFDISDDRTLSEIEYQDNIFTDDLEYFLY